MKQANKQQDFETPRHHRDELRGLDMVSILPGQFYVTGQDEVISTVLGSCVAACIRDPIAGVGGMNHFMLPNCDPGGCEPVGSAARYGSVAMESLINAILSNGGRRERLEVKLFGGGHVVDTLGSIGADNIAFARQFVQMDGLTLLAEDVGGEWARKLEYSPASGIVRVKKLRDASANQLADAEARLKRHLSDASLEGSIELFDETD